MSRSTRRAQATVVGVAVLLAMTVVSIGVITAATGTVVERGSAAADAGRAADALAALDDQRRTRLATTTGSLRVEPRTVRIRRGESTAVAVTGDALVYRTDRRRVVRSTGAVVVGRGDAARLRGWSPLVVGEDRLQISVRTLTVTEQADVDGAGPEALVVETNATHEYRRLQRSSYSLAVETAAPAAWERTFRRAGLSTTRRHFDEDGVVSVVARVDGEHVVDLAIHDLRTVIRRG